jgi:hypothetical protein
MKTPPLKVAGVILLVGAVLAAVAFQFFGSALVSPDTTPPSVTTIAPRVTETVVPIMRVHLWRILALFAVAGVGLLCVVRCRHHAAQGT